MLFDLKSHIFITTGHRPMEESIRISTSARKAEQKTYIR